MRAGRVAVAAVGLLLVPGVFLVDTGIALARGWQMGRGELWTAVVVGGIGALIAVALAVPRWRRAAGRNAPQVVMLVVVTVLMLCVVEWVMRKTERREGKPPHKYLHATNITREYNPTPEIMPGLSGKAVFKTEGQGLRASPMPAREKAYRVICVGGSTTECLYLDQEEAWSTLLGKDLTAAKPALRPVWSAGAGLSGIGSAEHLQLLKEAAVVDQMDCAVVLCGVNDLAKELHKGRGALFAGRRTRARNAARKAKEEAEAQENVVKGAEWANLAMFRRIETAVQAAAAADSLMAEDVLGKRYEDRRKARMAAPKVDVLPEGFDQALAEYDKRLQQIVDTVRGKKERLVLMTQPVLWKAEGNPPEEERLLWFGLLPAKEGKPDEFLSTPRLREAMDQYNGVMKRVAERNGVELVDLSPMSGQMAYFTDDCHFSEAGSREVARRAAEVIAAKGW